MAPNLTATASLHAVSPVFAPDFGPAEMFQPLPDLPLRPFVLVPVCECVVGVQQRPLAMQFVRQVITVEVGQDRRDPAHQRVAYPTVAHGAVQWKEEVDKPLGPFHTGLWRQPAE